jgi:D-threonate/D-erythronate kinase
MDTGLQCSKYGLETVVSWDGRALPDAEVLVLDTDSRAAPASEAAQRLCRAAQAIGDRLAYKKVDSTMRGNIGYELRALTDILEPRAIVVAPAFPQSGRTTLDGHQRVHGQRLEHTFFAHDPRWPMTESHLPTLLMQQAGREIGHIGLETVTTGAEALMGALEACQQEIMVVDALDSCHLLAIAQALVRLGPAWLPCGSAGLAEAWVQALNICRTSASEQADDRQRTSHPPGGGPVLILSGSRNDATVEQLRVARERLHIPCVELDAERFFDAERELARLVSASLKVLCGGQDVILTSTFSPLVPGGGPLIARILAEATAQIAGQVPLAGLFVTGGDIAVEVCRSLAVRGLRISQEVQTGIPGGQLLGGKQKGLWVVTKAGGFGDADAIVDAIRYLCGQEMSATT